MKNGDEQRGTARKVIGAACSLDSVLSFTAGSLSASLDPDLQKRALIFDDTLHLLWQRVPSTASILT